MTARAIPNLRATDYTLRLHQEDPMKGTLLELHILEDSSESVEFIENFRRTCFELLGAAPNGRPHPPGRRHSHWFLQGESGSWLMFEFWTQDIEAIREGVDRVLGALSAQGLTINFENCL